MSVLDQQSRDTLAMIWENHRYQTFPNKIIFKQNRLFYFHLSLCCEMSQQLGDRDLARGDLETESDMMCFRCYEFMLNS